MRLLLLVLLLPLVLPALGQEEREPRPNPRPSERPRMRNEEAREKLQLDLLERQEREEEEAVPNIGPPEIVPGSWQYDYDYRLNLFDYLGEKQAQAKAENRSTYVYVYADWNEACKAFRKSAKRSDYEKLFANSAVVMVEYVFLKRIYKAQINRVPILIQVHENGVLGPEFVHPISAPGDHPRKAYHKLKRFLESTGA